MKKISLILSAFLCLVVYQSDAQNYIGIHFNAMQPLNEYSDNLEAQPKGISMSYMFKPAIFKKLYIGVQTGVSMYAMDSYTENVKIADEEFMDVEIEEEDCFFSYKLTGRYFLLEDRLFNPYLEARIGGLSFFSTKMTEEEYDEYYENSTKFYGTTFQAGLGAGLTYHVIDNLWIDLNFLYSKGSRTNYRNIGSTDIEYRQNPELGKFQSYTDNINFSLGVQFGF